MNFNKIIVNNNFYSKIKIKFINRNKQQNKMIKNNTMYRKKIKIIIMIRDKNKIMSYRSKISFVIL